MDIQKKKNKMIDILPLKETDKPIIHLADIAAKESFDKKNEIKKTVQVEIDKQAGKMEILNKFSVLNQVQANAAPEAEVKNATLEIAKKNKIIDFTEEIFKKSKEAKPLLLQEKKSFSFKKYIIYFFIVLAAAMALYVVAYILPRAEIIITTKKSAWSFNDIIGASKDASNINLADRQIPAEIFKDIKTLTLFFPAYGKKYVERKAIGEVIIYNLYSSKPQSLTIGTRIESPDGKIFYLDKKITVPGAKIEEGKITASSIKAAVTAEKAGEEYNIAPVGKFTIVGFKGTAKYDKFYAVSNEAMKSGLAKDVLFPTEEDALAAKEKTSAQLSEDMNNFLSSQFNDDFKVFEWSRIFSIMKENIDKEADKNGNFLISIEGELKLIAFRESDVLKLMSEAAKQTLGQTFEIKNYNLNYGIGQYNADIGKTTLKIEFNGEFWQPISVEVFKNSVINKKENDLKIFVFSIPGVEKATISLWPRWVRRVPDSASKIKVSVN